MSDKFLICVDPDSYQVFSIGLNSRILVLEIDVPLSMRQKAINVIKEKKILTDSGGVNWWLRSKEGWAFRRRDLPKYLIHQDAN